MIQVIQLCIMYFFVIQVIVHRPPPNPQSQLPAIMHLQASLGGSALLILLIGEGGENGIWCKIDRNGYKTGPGEEINTDRVPSQYFTLCSKQTFDMEHGEKHTTRSRWQTIREKKTY